MSSQHKKPILAFVVLAVIAAAVVGNQVQARADGHRSIASAPIAAHSSVDHSTNALRAGDRRPASTTSRSGDRSDHPASAHAAERTPPPLKAHPFAQVLPENGDSTAPRTSTSASAQPGTAIAQARPEAGGRSGKPNPGGQNQRPIGARHGTGHGKGHGSGHAQGRGHAAQHGPGGPVRRHPH